MSSHLTKYSWLRGLRVFTIFVLSIGTLAASASEPDIEIDTSPGSVKVGETIKFSIREKSTSLIKQVGLGVRAENVAVNSITSSGNKLWTHDLAVTKEGASLSYRVIVVLQDKSKRTYDKTYTVLPKAPPPPGDPQISAKGATPDSVKSGESISFFLHEGNTSLIDKVALEIPSENLRALMNGSSSSRKWELKQTVSKEGANQAYKFGLLLKDGRKQIINGTYSVLANIKPVPSIAYVNTQPAQVKIGESIRFSVTISNPDAVSKAQLRFPDTNNSPTELSKTGTNEWSLIRKMERPGASREFEILVYPNTGSSLAKTGQYTVTPFLPLDQLVVTQCFGNRYDTYKGYHPGTDFRGSPGTAVRIMADGNVQRVGIITSPASAAGWYTVIDHPDLKVRTLYLHTEKPLVSEGQAVKAGQQLATLVNPTSFGPHLHIEVKKQDNAIVRSNGSLAHFVNSNTTPPGYLGYLSNSGDLKTWIDPIEFITGRKPDCKPGLSVLDGASHNIGGSTPGYTASDEDGPDIADQVSRRTLVNELAQLALQTKRISAATDKELRGIGVLSQDTLDRPTDTATRMESAIFLKRFAVAFNLASQRSGTRFTISEFGGDSPQNNLDAANKLYQLGLVEGQQDENKAWRYYPDRKISRSELDLFMKRLDQLLPTKPPASTLADWQIKNIDYAETQNKAYATTPLLTVNGNRCGKSTWCYSWSRVAPGSPLANPHGWTAQEAFRNLLSANLATSNSDFSKAPLGAIVFYDKADKNEAGHAAIKVGPDEIISQGNYDDCMITRVKWNTISNYLGYYAPGPGVATHDPNLLPKELQVAREEFLTNLAQTFAATVPNLPANALDRMRTLKFITEPSIPDPKVPIIRQDAAFYIKRGFMYLESIGWSFKNNADANRFAADTNMSTEVSNAAARMAELGIFLGSSREGGGYAFAGPQQLSKSERDKLMARIGTALTTANKPDTNGSPILQTAQADPTVLMVDQPVQFKLGGKALTSLPFGISLEGCNDSNLKVVSETTAMFTCTPRADGTKRLYWRMGNNPSNTLGVYTVTRKVDIQPSPDNLSADPFVIWKQWQEGPARVNTTQLRDGNVYKLTPAEVIYFAARENNLNPLVLLVKLQAEQNLIERANTSKSVAWRLERATGYGCPDSNPGCSNKWPGYYPQLVGLSYEFTGKRGNKDFKTTFLEYTPYANKYTEFVSIYQKYAHLSNSLIGKSYPTNPDSNGYLTDFRDMTAKQIQSFLEKYDGVLKNENLFGVRVHDVCPQILAPVCGHDKKTYGNDCEATRAGISVAYSGTCITKPVCVSTAQQVCGSDGFTHADNCVAQAAGTSVAYAGPCIVKPICTPNGIQVCGIDGKTYSDRCEADSVGVQVATAGACIINLPPEAKVTVGVSNPQPRLNSRVEVNLFGSLPSTPVDIYLFVRKAETGAEYFYFNRNLNEPGQVQPWRRNVMGPGLPEVNPYFGFDVTQTGKSVVGVKILPAGSAFDMSSNGLHEQSFTVVP